MRRPRIRWTQIHVLVLGGVFATFVMSACETPPKWVKTGSYTGQDAKAFYGVGEVMGIRNEPLAWYAAENRTGARVVKVLSTYTAYLMRDCAASTAAGGFKITAEEQHIEEATKTFASATLHGVRSVDPIRMKRRVSTMW